MTRRLFRVGLGLLITPAALAGQATVELYVPDTALTILTNRTGTAELQVYNASGVSSYNITIFLDDGRVQLVAADSVYASQLPPPTIVTGPEQVTLQASGTGLNTYSVTVARLTFHLDSLAQLGSLLSIRVNSLVDFLGADVTPGHRTGLLNLCQAEQIGGDASGDRVVNSRDALAVLTAAVGLSVPGGFDVGRPGDVDRDLQTTSRDALFILGYGIGISSSAAPLLNVWLINRCAPLAPAPNDMVFWRSGSLFRLAAADTLPAPLGVSGIGTYYARWSPNGARLAFTASISGLATEVLVVNSDGTGLDTLTLNPYSDFAPDWSPDGSQIAFVSDRVFPQSIHVMNQDGTGQTRVTTAHTVYDLAWSPDGRRLAFTGYELCCSRRLWVVNTDGTGVAEVFPESYVHQPQDPVWSPSGDSLLYHSGNRARVYKVSASGDTVAASALRDGQDSPWWANTVHTFRSYFRSAYNFFLRRVSDGRHLRLTAGPGSSDLRVSVRRTLSPPAEYPDTVTVTPDSLLTSPDSVDTLRVAVTNNTGTPNPTAPVSWYSRDTTIARVNSAGVVTAMQNLGAGYVVATSGWRNDSAKVLVEVTLVSVAAGGYHSCGLAADSVAYCWGYNAYGQMGTGTTIGGQHPMRVAGGLKFTSLTAGGYHTCGLTAAGAAYCWGLGGNGQLGDGTTGGQRTLPTAVVGGLAFASLEAGEQFTCGVTTANAGYCWGDNTYGQLGDSTILDASSPTPVRFGLPFASISAATSHACGVLTTGEGMCWGANPDGRLGDSTTTSRIFPDTVAGGRVWGRISAFNQHTCAVETTSDAAYCWGYNGWGQLGDSSFTNRAAPTAVRGGLTFGAIATGNLHTCGVTRASSAYCWGYNGYGELGDGTTSYRFAPGLVSGALFMTGVSGGLDYTCGTTGNQIYCWGYNGYAQLGDGTATNRSTPTRVVGQLQ